MRTVLVTGCAGFIGSHMTDILLNKNYNVIGVDALTYAGVLSNLNYALTKNKFKFYQINICETKKIKKLCIDHEVDCILNFAAEAHVDNSIQNCEMFLESNIRGVVSILNICKELSINLLHVSTDEVYGPANKTKFFEQDILNPKNPYAASKAAAEHFVNAFANTYNLNFKIVRASNNYGPRQHKEKFIPKIINCLLADKKIPIYGDGKQTREWIYVTDTAKAILCVLEKGQKNEVYNITSGESYDNITVVKKIANLLPVKRKNILSFVPDRPGHDRAYLIDGSKISSLGWQPLERYSSGLQKTIEYYVEAGE